MVLNRFDKATVLVVAGMIVACAGLSAAFGVRYEPDRLPQGDVVRFQPQVTASIVETVVRSLLKDPESARFGPIRKGVGDAWCGSVNAKNGFGGYVGAERFVVSPSGLFVTERDGDRFAKIWAEACR